MLYIRSQELISLAAKCLYTLINVSFPPIQTLVTINLLSVLWIWYFQILYRSEIICYLSSSNIPLSIMHNGIVVKVDILVLFLILGGMLSVFHHWECPLLCWCRFLLCPFFEEFGTHKWVLNFVKGFFCIYWDDSMVFFNLSIC